MDDDDKIYLDERSTPIPPMNAVILERNKDRILNIFSSDSIRIFDQEKSWGDIVDGLFGDLDVDQEWIRVFAIQRAYGIIPFDRRSETLDPEPMHDDTSSVDSLPIAPPPRQAVRKSAPLPEMSPVMNPSKKPFIATESILNSTGLSGYDFPSLSKTDSYNIRQITVTLSESTSPRNVIIKKCECEYDQGRNSSCICVSEKGKFLVPGKILKSRQMKFTSPTGESRLLNESEYLVSWRNFTHGDQYPNAWVSIDVLRQWRCGVLLDYLVSRIQYA
jgi:hypothetical protein